MSDHKHAPGPWKSRWTTQRRAGQIEAVSRCLIHHTPGHVGGIFLVAEINGPFSGEIEQAEANARLIAAAPELLEALQRIVREHHVIDVNRWGENDITIPSDALDATRAAIAKATQPTEGTPA